MHSPSLDEYFRMDRVSLHVNVRPQFANKKHLCLIKEMRALLLILTAVSFNPKLLQINT